jgi:hypothetical protein
VLAVQVALRAVAVRVPLQSLLQFYRQAEAVALQGLTVRVAVVVLVAEEVLQRLGVLVATR